MLFSDPNIIVVSSELLVSGVSVFSGTPTSVDRSALVSSITDFDAYWNNLEPTWSFLASDTITMRIGTAQRPSLVYPMDKITLTALLFLGWLPTLTCVGEKTEQRAYHDGIHEISICPSSLGVVPRTTGSRTRNEPLWIAFKWTSGIRIPPNTPVFGAPGPPRPPTSTDVLLGMDLFGRAFMRQDEIDSWRQEYEDFSSMSPSMTVPSRTDWVTMSAPVNRGNYTGGLDAGIAQRIAAVEAAFRNRAVVEAPVHSAAELLKLNGGLVGNPLYSVGEPVFIAPSATIAIESGYRNPRRNVEVGSKYPITSKHVWGRAIDITPGTVTGITPSGRTVALQRHEHIYPTLLQAARSVEPASIGEDGAVPVVIGSTLEDHVHMQW